MPPEISQLESKLLRRTEGRQSAAHQVPRRRKFGNCNENKPRENMEINAQSAQPTKFPCVFGTFVNAKINVPCGLPTAIREAKLCRRESRRHPNSIMRLKARIGKQKLSTA